MRAKSRRRSETHPVKVESTHTAAVRMIRMAATSSVDRILPNTLASPSVTWRTGWTSAPGRACAEPLDDGADFFRRTRSRDFNGGIRHMGPLGEVGKGHVHPAIFGRASLQCADRIQSNGASLKAEVEWLAGCSRRHWRRERPPAHRGSLSASRSPTTSCCPASALVRNRFRRQPPNGHRTVRATAYAKGTAMPPLPRAALTVARASAGRLCPSLATTTTLAPYLRNSRRSLACTST